METGHQTEDMEDQKDVYGKSAGFKYINPIQTESDWQQCMPFFWYEVITSQQIAGV